MRRWTLRILGVGVAAASLNVLVAWACVLGSPWPDDPVLVETPPVLWPVPVPRSWPAVATNGFGAAGPGAAWHHYVAQEDDGDYITVQVRRYGLPFRSLELFEATSTIPGVEPITRFTRPEPLRTPSWLPTASDDWYRNALPLRPVLPLFLANTLAYGAVLAGIPWAGAALRRRRRVRLGRCGVCGYDLRGSADGPCPECGAAPARERDRAGDF